ncbi:transglutaminase-like domain-containing protein [Alkaliphilus metalliredigens]|uniref:transglutaminase-like domain-containing protein n=1 Tax=Alkaliphilus metalliredigens TaxID=208226 RepID=UPI0009FC3EFC|nr:transglutaminase-like domain-containing protein [Alkaliphilus metalliredigens]
MVYGITLPYEKAQAIENYLQSNYPYSLSATIVPQYEDFVDHFLFETQTGYCTYYATAMTVMLRTQGIPARYIEGYRMPKKNEAGR